AKDLIGNQGSTAVDINVTRTRWIRSMPSGFGTLQGAVIVTPAIGGAPQILTASSGSNDTVASLSTIGALQRTQALAGSTSAITSNMAYSPQSNLLYVISESNTTMNA